MCGRLASTLEAGVVRPLEEAAEVVAVRLERAAAVAGQERGCSELRLVEAWAGLLVRDQRGRCGVE